MKLLALAGSLAIAAALVAAGCGGSSDASGDDAAPFDRAFIDAMVPHHQQAIEMSQAALDAELDEPALVDVAQAIVATQQTEIDQMKEWRGEWFGSMDVDPEGADALGLSMEEMGMQHGTMDFSTESDVNAAFASAMIDHHKGAIAMAELASSRAEHDEMTGFAADIVAAQQAEVAILELFATSDGMEGHDMGEGE